MLFEWLAYVNIKINGNEWVVCNYTECNRQSNTLENAIRLKGVRERERERLGRSDKYAF